MKNNKKTIKQRNPIAWAMCEARQFRNRVILNKKKKISNFNLNKELKNYKDHNCGLFC